MLGQKDIGLFPPHGQLAARQTYLKVRRRLQDRAIGGAATLVGRRNGVVEDRAVALTSMGPTPLGAHGAERALAGRSLAALAAVAEAAGEHTSPPSNTDGSSAFRRHLARAVVGRAIRAVAGA